MLSVPCIPGLLSRAFIVSRSVEDTSLACSLMAICPHVLQITFMQYSSLRIRFCRIGSCPHNHEDLSDLAFFLLSFTLKALKLHKQWLIFFQAHIHVKPCSARVHLVSLNSHTTPPPIASHSSSVLQLGWLPWVLVTGKRLWPACRSPFP
jgi:hypothetical protein